MDLPIFADYGAVPVDEDRGVEPALFIAFTCEFRVAEVETDAEFPGFFKERCGLRARHLFLIETVELGFVLDHPTRKESRQRHFGEHYELGAPLPRTSASDGAERPSARVSLRLMALIRAAAVLTMQISFLPPRCGRG
jgi:hypothetical protein